MTDQSTAPAYEPEARYRVRVSRPVQLGAFRYLPRDDLRIIGAALNAMIEENGADVVTSADRI